jgi:hypothetical protein
MFNPKAFEYMNYQFGNRIDNDYLYGGIYNNNILLIYVISKHLSGKPFLSRWSFRFSPTVNELKYFYNNLYNLPKSQHFIPLVGINIKEIITVDSIYYNPPVSKYIIFIKRIPIK